MSDTTPTNNQKKTNPNPTVATREAKTIDKLFQMRLDRAGRLGSTAVSTTAIKFSHQVKARGLSGPKHSESWGSGRYKPDHQSTAWQLRWLR